MLVRRANFDNWLRVPKNVNSLQVPFEAILSVFTPLSNICHLLFYLVSNFNSVSQTFFPMLVDRVNGLHKFYETNLV
jgi:hypothetical protein